MKIEVTEFGHTKDGSAVEAYRITNSHGAYVTVLNYGAIVKDIAVPDKDGHITDVVLGYDTLDKYETNPNFFGACIGRSGNRIANSTFTIDGREYHLTENEGHNNLHSGPDGFEKRIWKAVPQERNGCVSFSLVSPDGVYEFEASHGTVTKHYYRYLKGEKTSTNPIASIYAWTGGLKHRAKLDGTPAVADFAETLEQTIISTVEGGQMTKDLAMLIAPDHEWLDTEGFMDALDTNLRRALQER